jgi:hypothetical protein
MKIEYALPFRHAPRQLTESIAPAVEPQGRAPRIARLVALAHRLDQLVRSGEVSDFTALARLGHISRARLTQLMTLLHLSPPIQEYVLFLSPADARFVPELQLRKIAREPHWERQRIAFEQLLAPKPKRKLDRRPNRPSLGEATTLPTASNGDF